jgi:hypothetical protein
MRNARLYLLLLVLLPALAMPAVDGNPSGSSKTLCPSQTDSCGMAGFDRWPKSLFRFGMVMLTEVNAVPWNAKGDATQVRVNLEVPMGLEFSWGKKDWRFAILPALCSAGWNSGSGGDWQSHYHIGPRLYLAQRWKGLQVSVGVPKYNWDDEKEIKWSETSFGISTVILRWPDWGGKNFMPEFRHWDCKPIVKQR